MPYRIMQKAMKTMKRWVFFIFGPLHYSLCCRGFFVFCFPSKKLCKLLKNQWFPSNMLWADRKMRMGGLWLCFYALNHLKMKYCILSLLGVAIMNLFLTVVASLPTFTISVAVISSFDFFTDTMNGACSMPGPCL